MNSRHELVTRTYRPEQAEVDAARAHLPDGRTMDAYLRGCLRRLAAEPDRVLAELEPYWPPEKPRGRPRKTTKTT